MAVIWWFLAGCHEDELKDCKHGFEQKVCCGKCYEEWVDGEIEKAKREDGE